MKTTTEGVPGTGILYFALAESGMLKDTLRSRLKQWWGSSEGDPWVLRRSILVERPWPFYTLEEMQELSDLLLHEEERALLAQAGSAPPELVRRSLQVYRRYEAVALQLVQWRDQLDRAASPGVTARTFASFPGGPPEGGRPADSYTMVFPYDLRIIQEGALTYFVCPRAGQVMKVDAQRRVFLVRQGQERKRLLHLAEARAPWVLVGTPRAVAIGDLPDEAV